MSRRMSCSMTVEAVEQRIKTVTRRHPDTWRHLKPGDPLTLIEKGMGLPRGAKQRVLDEVVVVSNELETLRQVDDDEVKAEGLWDRAVTEGAAFADYYDPEDQPRVWFRAFWAAGHLGGTITDWAIGKRAPFLLGVECRRIEWRYPDEDHCPQDPDGLHHIGCGCQEGHDL